MCKQTHEIKPVCYDKNNSKFVMALQKFLGGKTEAYHMLIFLEFQQVNHLFIKTWNRKIYLKS